jgi:copper homeostasis protein (lipoprotein)
MTVRSSVISLLILILFNSCERHSGNATITVDTIDTETIVIEPVKNETVYEGLLPCADCQGIHTNLMLQGDSATYFLTETYLGTGKPDSVFLRSGTYTTLTAADSVTALVELSAVKESGPLYFEISGDTALIRLDMNAKRIQSGLNYTLIRQAK